MPLPPAAEAARLAAERRQVMRNTGLGFLICGFIASTFFYVTRAVGQDKITPEEVVAFRNKRALDEAAAANPPR